MRRKNLWAVLLCMGLLGAGVSVPAGEAGVATAEQMAAVESVLEDWMSPLPVSELAEGSYEVAVNCSSSMFSIEKAVLTVKDGEATALLTMGGTGYLYVYPGTGEEALSAGEDSYIPFVENEEGQHTFTIPVKELDAVTKCAAFSKRKELWYDRDLAFVSTSLPASAFLEARGTAVADLALEDGEYTIGAELSGGSGRTTIESPAVLVVKGGEATLRVVFSSPNYDYMIQDGIRYEPVNTEGNSAFEIPVAAFDTQLPVVADTVAMSKPHEISYTILLNGASLERAE